MLHMIQLRYEPEHRKAALKFFWEHGSTHYEGHVEVKGVWVATHEGIAYALVEASSESDMQKASAPLAEFGEITIHSVTSADEI